MDKHYLPKTNLPTHKIAGDLLSIQDDTAYYLPGDLIAPGELESGPQLKCVRMEVLPVPAWSDQLEIPLWKESRGYHYRLGLTLHVEEMDVNLIRKVLDTWLLDDEGNCQLGMKYMKHEIKSSTNNYHVVEMEVLLNHRIRDDIFDGTVIESPRFDNIWFDNMNALITEGVCYIHEEMNGIAAAAALAILRDSLRKNITYLAENTAVDYHPNSNDIVRDLVHPALYPYIEGVTKMKSNAAVEGNEVEASTHDFWGREYEDSKFQWLPTPFRISDVGKCTITEYVNNLDRDKFSSLYTDLEKLFEIFLPYFEEVWSYVKTVKFYQGDDDDGYDESYDVEAAASTVKQSVSLKGCELQVIVKIVEYTLQPQQAYEGVWHAEGMSHENIVMAGLYFIDRDADLVGGDLRFKRAFTLAERNEILFNIPQDRPEYINDFAREGLVPLGYFPTEKGYLFVFPNCHIHRISKLVNSSNTANASRRVVVFFVVNPDQPIISTRDVAPQQNVMTLEQAKNYRLELMAERKFDKEKLNVRDIELCEH